MAHHKKTAASATAKLPPGSSPGELSSRWVMWGGAALIVLAVSLIYWPCRNGQFLWDENELITDNALVKSPDGLFKIWFTSEPIDYWPVTNSVFWIQWHLWGPNPTGYHVTNVVLQIANALLIWTILRRLAVPGAFLAAVLFAVHPVNVESVAWISELKNVLSLFFALLSVLLFLKAEPDLINQNQPKTSRRLRRDHVQAKAQRWYWLSLGTFTLAMLSKGSVAILPVVLLLIVWWRRNRITQLDCIRTAPFFFIAAALTAANIWFQTHGTGEAIRQATLIQRLLGAGAVVWFYLYKALWPVNLIFVYPQWNIDADNILWWLPLMAAVLLTAVLIWQRRQSWVRPVLVAWLLFCVALLPVMGLADVYFMKYSLVADHYQYIAIISVLALAAAGFATVARQWPKWVAITIGLVPVVCCGAQSWQESHNYRDSITLFQTTIDRNPGTWMAHNNLGLALSSAGDHQEAMAHFQRAIALNPNNANPHANLAGELGTLDRRAEAIEEYQRAEQINPGYAPIHYNFAKALRDDGQWQRAIDEYQQTLNINLKYAEAHSNLAAVLLEHGQIREAIPHLQQAVRLLPNYAEAYNNLGIALLNLNQPRDAVRSFQEALRVKPDYSRACSNLAVAYAAMNQPAEAMAAAQKAIDLARSQGQTALAEKTAAWLAKFQSQGTN